MMRDAAPALWPWWLLVASSWPCGWAALHPGSPCPSIFSYEGTQPERERWYGVVLLGTDEPLVGVRIDVRLDRPAELVVSWMGTVTTDDNERFTILSLDQRLHPGPPITSRFMVKFNPLKGSPHIRTIRLNGRQICPLDSNKNLDSSPDIPANSQDNLYENRYTTERVTRRPDLDFNEDWTNSRPATPTRGPSSAEQYKPQRPSAGSYDTGNKNTGTGSYSSAGKDPVRTTTYSYDSHESYHGEANRRPSVSVSNTNYSMPNGGSQDHGSARPLGVDYERPAIIISVNKDVTYNVDRLDSPSYSGSSSVSRPSGEREPSYSNTQYQKTTERNYEHNSGGIREDSYSSKTTTKKPIVINSININIHSADDTPADSSGSSYTPKPTTRRPSTSNNNRNNTNTNSNRQTTRKPASRPSSSDYGNNRPNRNPEVSSESGYGQNGYNSNERTTTAKTTYGSSSQGSNSYPSNSRPSSSESFDSRPRPVPSSRPGSGNDGNNVPRPSSSGPKYGEEGPLQVAANANVMCGKVEVNPAPLITHGQNTMRGQWPWHIALYRIDGINLSYSCGGSLISSTLVITAAHCVTKGPRDRPVDADILVVQLGKYHLYQFSDDSVQNKQVRDVYVHPRYNSTNYLDDLAILVLSSPAEFTKYVRPVCLWPRHNFNLPSINDKEGTVVGWGYDENNQVTEELKMARMPVVSYVTCLKSYPQFFSQFTAENKTFCAGFRQGTSVCNGDSGGGMVFQQDGVWYLRGLVSITVAKQGLRVCDTNHYVVFTDIANYIDWIERYMS